MISSGTSTVQQNTGSSSEPTDPVLALTAQTLQPPLEQQNLSGSGLWEKWGVLVTILLAIIGAVAYFFVTIIGVKDEISQLKSSVSVLQSELGHIRSDVSRAEKITEKVGELGTDVAILKSRADLNEKVSKGR